MARTEFLLEIVTPERLVLSQTVTSITAYSVDGRLGILHDHRPTVTKLKIAPLYYKTARGEKESVAISGAGFLEVTPLKATVLCLRAELSNEIDIERAKKAKGRADDRLNHNSEDIDYTRARASFQRALARINAAQEIEE